MSEIPSLSFYSDPAGYAAVPAVAYDESSPGVNGRSHPHRDHIGAAQPCFPTM